MSADKPANDLFNASLATMLLTLAAWLGVTYSLSQFLALVKRVRLLVGTILVDSTVAPLIARLGCAAGPKGAVARRIG